LQPTPETPQPVQPQPAQPPQPAEPDTFPYDPNSRPDIDDPTDGYDPNAYDPSIEQYDPNQSQVPQGPTGQVSPPNEPIPEVVVTVDAGQDALLDCHIIHEHTAAEAASTATWSRDGRQLILDSSKYELQSNGSLVVKATTFNDLGNYACVTSSVDGPETGYVRLLVKGKWTLSSIFALSARKLRFLTNRFVI